MPTHQSGWFKPLGYLTGVVVAINLGFFSATPVYGDGTHPALSTLFGEREPALVRLGVVRVEESAALREQQTAPAAVPHSSAPSTPVIKVGMSHVEELAWRVGYCLYITKAVTHMDAADVEKILSTIAKEGTKSFSDLEWCYR